jgi:hypothetical protein
MHMFMWISECYVVSVLGFTSVMCYFSWNQSYDVRCLAWQLQRITSVLNELPTLFLLASLKYEDNAVSM